MPVEFRLHRFTSHLGQHSIQAERTLAALGHDFSEARMLLRRIYHALGQVEGVLIGAQGVGDELLSAVAEEIDALLEDFRSLRKLGSLHKLRKSGKE